MRFLRGRLENDVVADEPSRGTGSAATVSGLDEGLEFDVGPAGDESKDLLFDGEAALDPLRPPEPAVSEKSERRHGAVDGDPVRE